MKKIAVICIMACLITMGVAAVSETHAEADAGINENEPSTNYGVQEHFTIWGGQTMPYTPAEQGLVIFDDLLFDELRAAGMVIDFALLKLYVTNLIQQGDVKTYRVAGPWDETGPTGVTWDTRPDSSLDIVSMGFLPSGSDMWFETDVTDMARSWLDQSFPNHGFYVTVPEQGQSVGCQFASIDHPDTSIHPRLFIDYHQGGDVEEDCSRGISLDVSCVASGSAIINFTLPVSNSATLSIYDVTGFLIDNLSIDSSTNSLTWKGSPGVYFVRLETPDRILTDKFIVVE